MYNYGVKSITLDWIRYQTGWCNFLSVDLTSQYFNNLDGVYIIWHGGANASTVYVGQGFIGDRLKKHREEKNILVYSPNGLYTTWAKASSLYMDGVERYLADTLSPKVGKKYPDVNPIIVNLPWR